MSSQAAYTDSIKQAFISVGKKVIVNAFLKSFPGLGLLTGPVGYFAGMFMTFFVHQIEIAIFFVYVDMRVAKQAKEFEAASEANRIAQLRGTDAEKQLAEKNLIAAFDKLVRFNR